MRARAAAVSIGPAATAYVPLIVTDLAVIPVGVEYQMASGKVPARIEEDVFAAVAVEVADGGPAKPAGEVIVVDVWAGEVPAGSRWSIRARPGDLVAAIAGGVEHRGQVPARHGATGHLQARAPARPEVGRSPNPGRTRRCRPGCCRRSCRPAGRR